LYGVAGVLIAGFIATPDISVGSPYQLASITVVAIAGAAFSGGPASIASVLCASVFLTLLDQTLALRGLSAGARVIAQGVALAAAISILTMGQFFVTVARRLLDRRGNAPARGSDQPRVSTANSTALGVDGDGP
jgi:ribose transport system permease protein